MFISCDRIDFTSKELQEDVEDSVKILTFKVVLSLTLGNCTHERISPSFLFLGFEDILIFKLWLILSDPSKAFRLKKRLESSLTLTEQVYNNEDFVAFFQWVFGANVSFVADTNEQMNEQTNERTNELTNSAR